VKQTVSGRRVEWRGGRLECSIADLGGDCELRHRVQKLSFGPDGTPYEPALSELTARHISCVS